MQGKSLKIKHILEARYAAPPDTECKRCGERFNFDSVQQQETSHFTKSMIDSLRATGFTKCPGCQMKILRDTRKKLREAKYAGDPRESQWFKDLQHIIRHNIHEYGDTDRDQEAMYRWANDYKQILEKLYREVIQSRDTFIEDWNETWYEDHPRNVSEELQKKRREHAADLWLSTEEHFKTSSIYGELRRRHSIGWVDTIMNLMVDVAGGIRE